VKAAEVAIPDALLIAVFSPPANVPEAPLAGAENVTVTPPTGLPPESFTVATKRLAKGVPTVADCGVPLVAVIVAVLLSVKLYVVALE